MKISVKYKFGDKVVLKTKPDEVRIITGWLIRPAGRNKNITYGLGFGEEESWHQDVELEAVGLKIFKVKGFVK